jgi:DNA-binding LytR/AlgR family response regulator
MEVNIYEDPSLQEDRIDIHCQKQNAEINDLINYINKKDIIIGTLDSNNYVIKLSDIYYIETIDKTSYAYTENMEYKINATLKQIETLYYFNGFIRINKSTIINVYKIKIIKNDFEMRMLVYLYNDEKLIINRHYKDTFQAALLKLDKIYSG